MTQEFSGIGILINKNAEGLLKVESPLEDSPAYRAGLDADDTIIAIDGKSTANMTLEMAVSLITGPENTDVVLTIERKGLDKPRDFRITRQRIVVQTVKGLCRDQLGRWKYFVDEDRRIGYVRLTNFTGETPRRLKQVLEDLKAAGMKGLILDLRYNSGGYLNGAVEVSDYFLDSGLIVSTRPDRPSDIEQFDYATKKRTIDARLPMVVLINGASASAAEIVSGALKDHGRAVIVGTRSYGKGSVQQIQQLLPSVARLKLTIAYYFLPNGGRVNRDPHDKTNKNYGVEPDVTVELVGKQAEEYLKVRREASILHRSSQPDDARAWAIYTPEELLDSDPQLKVALLCMRARLLADAAQSRQGHVVRR